MKASTAITTLGMILFSMVSCEKSSDLDMESLQLQLESCKPKKGQLAIGMEYQGGIIFYLDETGRHGKISAKTDLGPAPWGCFGTEIPGARTNDGQINTLAILTSCSEAGIAARLCAEYVVREKDGSGKKYRDWYMPSRSEFTDLVHNLQSKSNTCGKAYWCSTEEPAGFLSSPVNQADRVNVYNVVCAVNNPDSWGFFYSAVEKFRASRVRPIRTF